MLILSLQLSLTSVSESEENHLVSKEFIMENAIYPRVNSKFLPQFSGRQVTLFGEVLNCTGDTCFVKASDGGEVPVQLPPGESLES